MKDRKQKLRICTKCRTVYVKSMAGSTTSYCSQECKKAKWEKWCKRCGDQFEGARRTQFCSMNCAQGKQLSTCVICESEFKSFKGRVCCSRDCGFEFQRRNYHRRNDLNNAIKSLEIKVDNLLKSFEQSNSGCSWCGVICDRKLCVSCRKRKTNTYAKARRRLQTASERDIFKECCICSSTFNGWQRRLDVKTCSDACQSRLEKTKKKTRKRRRRAKKAELESDGIPDKWIFERASWQCQYCGIDVKPCDGVDFGALDMATIDHVIPLSKGGDDTEANKACACFECNFS